MPQQPFTPTLKLAQYILAELPEDMEINGKLIPAGTQVCVLPQTTAHSVRVPGEQSLLEAWSTLSRTDHAHPDHLVALARFEEQLVRMTDRMKTLEVWAAENGCVFPPDLPETPLN